MSDSKNKQVPKDKEESEKYYGDEHNNQRTNKDSVKRKSKGEPDEKTDNNERSKSNVLTHPKDKEDESFEVKDNEKEKDKKGKESRG